MRTRLLSLGVATLAMNPPGLFANPVEGPKIAGHLSAYTTKAICTSAIARPPCNPGQSNMAVHGDLNTSYNLYLVVLDGNSSAGIAGAAFGIEYNGTPGVGMDIYSWIMCADVEYSGGPSGVAWPASGSGNMIIWDVRTKCQKTSATGDLDGGVTAVLGSLYVYAYSADLFSITRRNYVPTPDLNVCTCSLLNLDLGFPEAVGKVGFGATQGVDPCQ